MQTLIHQKTVSQFPALLPPPNFLFSQARKNHDLLRFRTKIGFKTLTLCSVASLPPLSYGGWEDFQLAGDSGESEMWAGPEGVHTLSSHGVRVAKTHMHDWLILVFLGSIILALNFIHPFHRFVGKDMMSDLKYPHKHNTTPFWNVVLSAVPLPVIVFLVLYLHQRDVYDLHHAILGILLSVMVTGVITDAIKDAVGCPRTFFW